MPGGGNTVRGGVRATDDRRRALILVETAFPVTVNRLKGGDGYRVDGSHSTETAL